MVACIDVRSGLIKEDLASGEDDVGMPSLCRAEVTIIIIIIEEVTIILIIICQY